MLNALPRNSPQKWSKIVDSRGNNVIPFVITGIYDQHELRIIYDAMHRLEQNTCIRFRKRSNERDYIDIQNQASEGCYTSVGRLSGRNIVMLEANDIATCIEPDIVIHELFHTIGLWHEHMRYDRDNYITVHYKNINPMYQSQFDKVSKFEAETYGIPYDYTSVMHYAETAFAIKGKISMETKDPAYQKVIGHHRDASVNDYKKICMIYGCSKCIGASFNIDELVMGITPIPITKAPIQPLLPLYKRKHKECYDVFPPFCYSLSQNNILDCNFLGNDYCCSSCASQRPIYGSDTIRFSINSN
uniref:Metalloendopeptidase n=1 Tax=Heterorhabditis bacteriophora TaxID=37862 RepID=A0A1I7XCE9_HETBA